MVDKTVVENQIKELKSTIDYLKNKLRVSENEYLSDIDIQAAVERKLEIGIQLSIDIGAHIISQKNLPYPDTYRAIFEILGNHRIINIELAEKLQKMAGFRNILVHDYVKIDSREVFKILHTCIKDFELYLKEIVEFINL